MAAGLQGRRYQHRNGRTKLDFATATSQWTISCWAFGLLTLCLFSRGSTSTSAEKDVVNARPKSRELSTYYSSYYSTYDEREYLYDRYLDDCAFASDLFDCFCHPEDFSDGECNYLNNYELCNYDGGDCCEETCIDSTYKCGISGYDCWDPDQERKTTEVSPDYTYLCNDIWLSDGHCDDDNNVEECSFDGGDCCVDSCVDAKYTCGVTYRDQCDPQSSDCNLRLICLDPVYKTPAPTPTLFNRTCPVEDIGNGRCDDEYNNEFCLFDGGDCCAPSCLGESCGAYEYDCKDPNTPEYGLECNMDYVGDGECDSVTNSQECQYDGGDCCELTCKDSVYMCGVNFFNCTGPLPYNAATALSILGCSGSWLRYILTVMVASVGWEIW
ncbi:unnamed protein product [Ectocarpus sp. CCAP 1310/34]|nr:unnamed protein product [Ectocarpus sp. CCAP 1310/34]